MKIHRNTGRSIFKITKHYAITFRLVHPFLKETGYLGLGLQKKETFEIIYFLTIYASRYVRVVHS